jgi:hypothetical protein
MAGGNSLGDVLEFLSQQPYHKCHHILVCASIYSESEGRMLRIDAAHG